MSKVYAKWINKDAGSLEDNSGALRVKLDDSSLELDAGGIRVKAAGVTSDMLAGSIAFSKLADSANIARLDQTESIGAVWAFGSNVPTISANPTNDNDVARKAYVDAVAAGLQVKGTARAGTTAALPACTYDNGTAGVGATLTGDANGALAAQDGITLIADEILLVKNQVAGLQDGRYVLSQVGDGGTPFILTRATDCDEAAEIPGATVYLNEGTAQADDVYVCTANAPITMGTTDLVFEKFSGAGQIIAGTAMVKSGDTLNVVDATNGGLSMNADDMNLDLDDLSAAVIDVSADSFAIIDANDSNASRKEAIADFITAIGGNGLADSSGVLSVDVDSETGGNIQGANVTANGVGLDISAIAGTGIEADGSANLRLATQGTGIAGGNGSTLSLSINALAAAAVDVSADSIAILDNDDSITKKESIADFVSGMAGNGLASGSGALALDLNELVAAVVDVSADSIGIVDANDSNGSKKESIVDFVAAIAGTGLSAASGVLSASSANLSNEMHIITAGEVSAGYLTLAQTPSAAAGVSVNVVNGIAQVNKQVVGATGATPDFDVLSSNQLHINNNGAAAGLSEELVEDDILIIEYVY